MNEDLKIARLEQAIDLRNRRSEAARQIKQLVLELNRGLDIEITNVVLSGTDVWVKARRAS